MHKKTAEDLLVESEAKFKTLFTTSPDPTWIIDENNIFILCNKAAANVLGYNSIEELQSTHPSELSPEFQPDGQSSWRKANYMMARAHRKGIHRFEWEHRRSSGECFPVEVTLSRVKINGKDHLYCTWRDITKRKQAEQKLLESEELTRLLLDSVSEGFFGLDLNGNCTFVNKASVDILGYDNEDELIGRHMHGLIHHSHSDESEYPVEECKVCKSFKEKRGAHINSEVFWRTDGTSIPVEYSSYPIHKGGVVVGSAVVFHDITERKLMEDKLKLLASTDGLTSLYNHNHFNEKLEDEVQRAIRFKTPLSLLILDIDYFKKINDAYGHPVGDACLAALGSLMRDLTRTVDTCARYGGDEFAIILPQTPPENAMGVAERFRQKVEILVVKYSGQAIQYTVSIGMSALDLTQEKTAKALLKSADLALYDAKERDRNCVVSYSRDNTSTLPLVPPH